MSLSLYNIECGPHVLYHCSPTVYTTPTMEKIISQRPSRQSKTHDNSVLGLWCSTFPEKCSKGFGDVVYQVDLNPNSIRCGIDYGQFYKACMNIDSLQGYADMRKSMSSISALYIMDTAGHIGEVIVLDMQSISSFTRVYGATDTNVPLKRLSQLYINTILR